MRSNYVSYLFRSLQQSFPNHYGNSGSRRHGLRDIKETDGRKSAVEQIRDIENNWEECFLLMAKGDPVHLEKIKAMPIMQFWRFYDDFMKRIKQETDLAKAKNKR